MAACQLAVDPGTGLKVGVVEARVARIDLLQARMAQRHPTEVTTGQAQVTQYATLGDACAQLFGGY